MWCGKTGYLIKELVRNRYILVFREGVWYFVKKESSENRWRTASDRKKYSNLKLKQTEKIYAWMLEETKRFHDRNGKYPEKKDENTAIVEVVYDRIERAGIWIPYGEVLKHYKGIKVKLRRRIRCNADAGGKICTGIQRDGKVVAQTVNRAKSSGKKLFNLNRVNY